MGEASSLWLAFLGEGVGCLGLLGELATVPGGLAEKKDLLILEF